MRLRICRSNARSVFVNETQTCLNMCLSSRCGDPSDCSSFCESYVTWSLKISVVPAWRFFTTASSLLFCPKANPISFAIISHRARPRRRSEAHAVLSARMDVEALLREDDDDVLTDIDMTPPEMETDLVDFEDMPLVPEPLATKTEFVPTGFSDRAVAVAVADKFEPVQTHHQGPVADVTSTFGDGKGFETRSSDGPIETGARQPRCGDGFGFGDAAASPAASAKRTHETVSPMQVEEDTVDGGFFEGDEDLVDDELRKEDRGRNVAGSASCSGGGAQDGNLQNKNTLDDDDDADAEMRDQHTFVPLEPNEVKLAERICRRVDEPKKHLVRLLIKTFGAGLADGALKTTEAAFAEAKKQSRNKNKSASDKKAFLLDSGLCFFAGDNGHQGRVSHGKQGATSTSRVTPTNQTKTQELKKRSPGGVFIWVLKQRAPAAEFKNVMKRSAEIDKLLRKQMEAKDLDGDGGGRARKRVRLNAHTAGHSGNVNQGKGGRFGDPKGGGGGGRFGAPGARGNGFGVSGSAGTPNTEKPKTETTTRTSNTAYAEDV